MRCEDIRNLIGDRIDDAVGATDREAIDRHVAACDACRAVAADVRAIRDAARTLPRHEPPARIWEALSSRIAGDQAAVPRPTVLPWRTEGSRAWLALAAMLLLATLAGIAPLVLRSPADPGATAEASGAGDDQALVASVEANLQAAESHYERAIADLQKIAQSDSEALDPQLAAVFERNLQVVDQAIGESRAALREQPASEQVQESFFDAMRTKVALLQQTVELINEMRKGNQAEAGRIIQGISQP